MNRFEFITGHDEIKEHLQTAIKNGNVFHAYLFQGETGTGKKLMARTFAAGLQCTGEGEKPCGECISCKQAATESQPDITWLTKEKAGYGVEEIREQLNHAMPVKPYGSPYKIFIIPEAETMTEQAQNAVLKTIEEPPTYGIVILLTNNADALLPTIRSRCMKLEFRPLTTAAVEQYLLEHCGVPDYLARTSATFAQGNLGKAIRYARTEDFIKKKDLVFEILQNVKGMTVHEMLSAIKMLGESRAEVEDYIDLMVLWYRDVLVFKATKDVNQILLADEYSHIMEDAKYFGYDKIEEILQGFDKAKVRLRANVNFEVAMELMLLNMKE